MNRLRETLAIIISIIVTNITMYIVLQHNLSKGIYSPETDSIAIPIVGGFISSGLLLILMLPSILIPQTRKSFIWIQIILLAVSGVFAGLNAYGWVFPNHYPVAISYLFVFMISIWLIVRRSGTLASIKPSNPA
jgi:hypothetical protein